jgi:nucleobindin
MFQGITVEEARRQHEPAAAGDETHPPPETDPQLIVQRPGGENPILEEPSPQKPKVTRLTPPEKQEPAVKFKDAGNEAARQAEWGSGDAGYKPPSSPSDKMRKNLPYKVKATLPLIQVVE